MGLFSSKKKTKVGTSVSRIIEDKRLPNAVRQGILTSTFQQKPVSYSIQKALYESVGFNADRMYDYAKRKYTYGLPSGKYHYSSQGMDKVKAIIERIEGAPVSMIYSRLGEYNYFHYLNVVGLNSILPINDNATFTVTINGHIFSTTRPGYFTNLTIAIPSSEQDDVSLTRVVDWGAPTHYVRNWYAPPNNHIVADIDKPELRVNYFTITPSRGFPFMDGYVPSEEVPGYFSFPLDEVPNEGDYFQAAYKLANGTVKFWTYELGKGTYPELDALHNEPPTTGGTFFPFAYFRFAKSSMDNQKGTDSYKTTETMLKKIGMDLADVTEAIHENPDIKDIEQAMFYMGVPGVTKDPIEARYLFDFFNNIYMAKGYVSGLDVPNNLAAGLWAKQLIDEAQVALGMQAEVHTGAFTIADKRFKMSLNNNGIYKRLVAGSIGAIGSYSCTTTSYQNAPNAVSNRLIGTAQYDSLSTHGLSVRYRHQVSSQVYEEIQVVNPGLTYHIYGSHTTIGSLSDEEIFLVPIDKSISSKYSLTTREQLYARSMHYVFNSRITTRVKWYQQGWFSAVIQIVGIVISIISMQPGFASMAAAASAGTAAIITLIAKGILQVLIRFAVATAAKYILKEVAPQLLTIVAVVAAVVAIVGGVPEGLSSTPWAEHLLSASNVLMSTGQSNLQNLMSGLTTEAESFLADAEQKMKLLEDTQDLLYNDPILMPLVVFGESPQDFYRRTVHSGNVGTLAIKSVSTYVRRSLTLPTVQQTLGATYV